MTNKLTAASGTNPFMASVWIKRKALDPTYKTNITYNGIFEFSKALRCYYSESTAHSRAEVYQPWLKERTRITQEDNIDHKTLEQVSKHTLELLVNTCKEEVNNRILLEKQLKDITIAYNKSFQNNIVIKNKLTVSLDKNVIQALEIKQMKKRYTTRLERAEKNRKDPHYREQLIKYSLLMLFGFILFGLIQYL